MRTIIIAALLCGMMAGCTNSNKQTTGNNTAELSHIEIMWERFCSFNNYVYICRHKEDTVKRHLVVGVYTLKMLVHGVK